MKILLIEDDKWMSDTIVRLLKHHQFFVDQAFTGTDGLNQIIYGDYDAVILDVMLPEMDGFEVLKNIRAKEITTPVLMLTARGDVKDRIKGLDIGADYYIPKPFDKDELIACLRAIIRRKDVPVTKDLSYHDIHLSEADAMLYCDSSGKNIKLSAKEYQLMELFLINSEQIISKDIILDRIWGYENNTEYNNPEVYITFLRRKLSFLHSKVKIFNRRGFGYFLEVDNG